MKIWAAKGLTAPGLTSAFQEDSEGAVAEELMWMGGRAVDEPNKGGSDKNIDHISPSCS